MAADIRASTQPGSPTGRPQHRHLRRRARRGGRPARVGRDGRGPRGARRGGGLGGGPRARHARQRATSPSWCRYDRYGNRVDEVRFHPSWHWLMERGVGYGLQAAPVDVRRPARPRAPRRRVLRLVADRAGPRLPDLDDVRRGAGAAGRRRDRQGVDAPARVAVLRLRAASGRGQGRRARRHGHDREAGRLRRARQRDHGDADVGRRGVHPRRAQVVHLRADERRVPGAGPGRRRAHLLPGAAGARRRQPQPAGRRTPQGQAGQPLQRVLGARVPRHLGAAARRRGPGRAHDHRDGRRDPAGLRARLGVADAPRRWPRRRGTSRTARRSAACSPTSR